MSSKRTDRQTGPEGRSTEPREPALRGGAGRAGSIATANLVTIPVTVPEIDPETTARLEQLSAEYRERVIARYAKKGIVVDGYIKAGKLPEAYRLPKLSDLIDRVVALAPVFEYQQQSDWEPELEFVPQGLSHEQWNDLFTGHMMKDYGSTLSQGVYRPISGQKVDPSNPKADASLWDIEVISSTEKPVIRFARDRGSNGERRVDAKTEKVLAEMPGVIEDSLPVSVLVQVSPREEAYYGAQLSRLERNQPPLEDVTLTVGKEMIEVKGEIKFLALGFHAGMRRIRTDVCYASSLAEIEGIRPTISGRDLVLN